MENEFTNAELTDMVLVYGEVRQNGRAAQRLYIERYPGRRHPSHRIFVRLIQRLRDTGSLEPNLGRDGGQQRIRHNFEDVILNTVHADPTISTRQISRYFNHNVSHMSVWRSLRDQRYHPFHFQRVQDLTQPDHPQRVMFSEWLLQQHARDQNFVLNIIFSDEAIFTRNGIYNFHNSHYWSHENPHVVRRSNFQHRFSVNVWAGIVNGTLIGPHILPNRMNGNHYLEFLQNTLPELLEDIPLNVRQHAWFQHDGAPPHYTRNVREHLNNVYEGRWIGRGGPVSWPPRSPDLNPLDYYFWGYFKSLVYDNQDAPETLEELQQRIENSAVAIRQTNHFHTVCAVSLIQRATLCVAVNGGHFEQFLN